MPFQKINKNLQEEYLRAGPYGFQMIENCKYNLKSL